METPRHDVSVGQDLVKIEGLVQSPQRRLPAVIEQALSKSGMIIAATDKDSGDALENLPGAFGSITLAQVISEHRNLNILKINQIQPSPSSIADRSYPFYRKLYLVMREPHSASEQAFVAFVQSKRGRALLEANGHWVPQHAP